MKINKIWYEDGPDRVEEDVSVDVRLLVEFQKQIPAETKALVFDVLLNS
jgi:hypothetical protein